MSSKKSDLICWYSYIFLSIFVWLDKYFVMIVISWFLCTYGKDNFIVIFGGEIDPSNRGHEGAGGFSNELFLINEDTLEIKILSRKDFPDMDWPISRGWSSGSSISNEQFLIFGGLTGDDKDPMRLNDLWTCTIHE